MVLIGGLAGVIAWGSMLMAPWDLATGLLDARDHLRKAQKSLSRTQLKAARYEALAAAGAVRRAERGLEAGGPILDLARTIEPIDDALGEVDHLIAAVEHSARAALGTLDVAQDSLRGPRAVVVEDPEDPKGKKIDLDRLEELTRTIAQVSEEVASSERELRSVDLDALPRRAHGGIRDGIETAAEAQVTLRDAQAGLQILPSVLGRDGPRTYMIGFQNTAEQRGTGGAILRFGFMQIADGAPHFDTKTTTVYDVDRNREQVSIPLPPDAWYVAAIPDAQRFGNANWSPDWPSSAQLTVAYAEATPQRDVTLPDIDGVIVVDPLAAQKLMPGAGPFNTKAGNRISARKIVHFTLYKAYASHPVPAVRRTVLNQVVDGFYERLFNPLHPTELLNGFGSALGNKNVQMWMADPVEQAFIERMGWDGAITPPEELKDDDYVFVVEQNVGGSKLDFFDTNTNTMRIGFEGDDALVTTRMSVRNGVFLPQPRHSMGDSQTRTACRSARCPLHRPMLNLYVREDAELLGAKVSGDEVFRIDTPAPAAWAGPESPPTNFEHGKKVWSGTLQIPPQAEGALTFDYRVPEVVQERGRRKVYRLHVQHQPKVLPEILKVVVELPPDAAGVRAPGFTREGDLLVWERELVRETILEVSWRK